MSKILITGGSGLIGHALRGHLPDAIFLSSKDCDLTKQNHTDDLFYAHKPDYVIHLAGKVGGVKANTDNMADFFYDNIMINTNVLHCAYLYKTKKVVSLMSTCIFPDVVSYPITEDQLHNGNPHYSNFGYAHSKRMLDVQSRSYRQQYGCNFVTVVPNNLYGPHDNFDLENSHVIPAIIRKIYNAKVSGKSATFWGDGSPRRQFTYVDDLAEILAKVILPHYNDEEPINVGCGDEYSIKEIVGIVSNAFNYDGGIKWEPTEYAGQHIKTTSFDKFKGLGYGKKFTPLDVGIRMVVRWWERNYIDGNIRGINESH